MSSWSPDVLSPNLLETRRLRVLIVDDNALSVAATVHFLEQLECDVDFAWSGHAALTLIEQHQYDLLIIDWMMPDLGGRRTLQLMQTEVLDGSQAVIPYVIHSALGAHKIEIPETRNLAFIDQWHKLMARTDLVRKVNEVIGFVR